MAFFPKIQSPCPYKGNLAAIMDGDVCRLCKREVFDLTGMDEGAQRQFFAACAGEVCVSYAVPLRPVVAAAAMAVAVAALPSAAAAQETAEVNLDVEEIEIFVGGIKDPANVEFVEDPSDSTVPELPVVYEEEPAAQDGTGMGGDAPATITPPSAA